MRFKKLLRIIFGRTTILAILFLLQIGVLLGVFKWLGGYVNYIYGGFTILSALVIVYILNSPSNPNFKIAWIIPVLVIPVVGVFFYLYVQLGFGTKGLVNNIKSVNEKTKDMLPRDEALVEEIRDQSPQVARLADYIYNTSNLPVYKNSSAEYFPLGEDAFEEMLIQLEQAEHFIFMEYFIIEKGRMLNTIQDILAKKVTQGVEVRFMYDGMVALNQMPNSYLTELKNLGIRAKQFSPIKPILSTSYNNRDHRKILVIDGKVAFTGGINLADEYINEKLRFGHWKDNAIMVKGDAARSFTMMFLQMWHAEEGTEEDYERYLRIPHGNDELDGYIMPYGDNPFDADRIGESVYLDLINTAEEYVHIMTPYLIIDDQMVSAMAFAAKSGVDVKIIMPHIPDKWSAYTLARTYYEELIRSGVKIYEYTPGFIHSKVFVSDNKKATVGTVNLDYRSLYLHFECGVYIYGGHVIDEIDRDFDETLEKSHLITLEAARDISFIQKFVGRFCLRLFAPLL